MRKQVRRRHEAHIRAQSVYAEHSPFFDATPGGQKAHVFEDILINTPGAPPEALTAR